MIRLACLLTGHLWLDVFVGGADRVAARCDRCGAFRVTA